MEETVTRRLPFDIYGLKAKELTLPLRKWALAVPFDPHLNFGASTGPIAPTKIAACTIQSQHHTLKTNVSSHPTSKYLPSTYQPRKAHLQLFEGFSMDSTQLLPIILAVVALAMASYFLAPKSEPTLSPEDYRPFTLKSKTKISPNTAIYRFSLPSEKHILGLPIGQHISIRAEINGKNVQRSYTPVSSDDDRGYFDLLIKTYDQGNISKYVANLQVGDSIQVRGPKGQMKYHAELCNKIGMIAGGTGITPMLQIIRACAKDPKDNTQISLIYANVNEEDILLKQELDEIHSKHPKKFSAKWNGGVGFVSKEMIAEKLPSATEDSIKILLCGPPPMTTAMKKYLEELDYEKCKVVSKLNDQVFCF
ncbi:uncharacterized protein MELLADRAFT_85788 [Melampsora larici-populina 98AG31]|uniref:NADH-cytochrome b5 reductase n=1 Tax=Melampsora larici-populina (strain 98AG31 / pathotype 3-4-7) TaxID=747676 RepID=F4RJS4_MELLP|nr:uncharacterized protein MELLADRAFT_85788 [Melampsora larici-populina 98AG31]EGG07362.1 hypothetical protein MELLADRAFT_85788 [Melampsora larici-populina 98AG31]